MSYAAIRARAQTSGNAGLVLTSSTTINALPDKLLVEILSYLPPADRVHRCSLVCKRWQEVAVDGRLWRCVNLRPDLGGFLVRDPDTLVGTPPPRVRWGMAGTSWCCVALLR